MKDKAYIVWLVLILAAFGMGLFVHKKWIQEPIPEPLISTKIDSLMKLNDVLTDSIAYYKSEIKQGGKEITRWRTKYDTIQVASNSLELIQNLRAVANTPIPNE